MIKRAMAIGVAMVMLLVGNLAWSEDCGIVNPSFEDDGRIDDIAVQAPNGWDVNLLDGKFYGFIYTNWHTDASYNLSLYLNKRVDYYVGDTARVSQTVPISLSGVRQITFDVKLDTGSGPWDPNVCTAVVLIDDDVVWESDSSSSDVRGEYRDQVYVVEEKYKGQGLHAISVGMRMNVEAYYWTRWLYQTHWDMVDCDLYCGGAGPIMGDINDDCCVDANDLKLLAEVWLSDDIDPNDPANLSDIGDNSDVDTIIDFRDFAVYADSWDGSMMVMEAIAAYWLDEVDPYHEYNLFGRPYGEINFFDLAVLANNWLQCSVVEEQ